TDGCGKAAAARRIDAAKLDPWSNEDPSVRELLREAFDDTDVLHYDLEIEIDPNHQTIDGVNTITVRSLVPGLTEFTFRLRDNFTITSATINGGTPVTITNVSTTTRTATLDRAYDPNETFDLTIAYNGVAVSRGFGSIEFTTQNGLPLISTLSEPYYAYTWWPCKDGDVGDAGDNADKATIDIAIIAPNSLRSVSNGVLAGVDHLSGGRDRYRWSTNYPIATYLVCFSSSVYNTWTVNYDYGSGTMPVEFNIFPADDTSGNRAAWEKCVTMLGTLAGVYGEYPFVNEKYGMYQFGFGGGMEHQTNTGQGGFWEDVTAHELGHQWWGDDVTCRTWHDIWLNEGFATYTVALWREFKPGSSGIDQAHAYMATRVPSSMNDSVYVYDTSSIGRIFSSNFSYKKASWVLHQLRHVIGDTAFFDTLAAYRAAFSGSAATTDDFAAIASSVAGQDLTWFFNEWVYGIGAPTYEYGWQTENIGGQDYLRLSVSQVQTAGYGVYQMPIDVKVTTAGGDETIVIWNDDWSEHYVLPISAAATAVVLDPDDWILTEGKTDVGYVAGPPAIVQASPAPGESFGFLASPTAMTITFSEDVAAASEDFDVTGATTGPAAFTLSYDSGSYTATLDFGGALPADQYTVTVSDSLVSAGASIALDGELADGQDPNSLPSGEGQPGGSAVMQFHVATWCDGDVNGDGGVDLTDLAIVLANFDTASGATRVDGDIDGDGDVDLADLAILLANYDSVCP
ncbi:MAG: hypothetical protein D6744_10005, partial [Planctomycetota bacterium]